jgi:endonuclease/exonuclease/phosphatase family metal-dependent hydrolase
MSTPVVAGWEPPYRIETRLRVLTWNLWWRFGPWEARQPAILATLRRIDPDVLCLQEVWETREEGSQAAVLAEALDMQYVYATGLPIESFSESLGNAVLSRWPITGSETRALPAPPGLDELRVVVRADIEGPRGPLEVFCTHLNWRLDQSAVRQQQVAALCEFVAETRERRERPPIVCGDFNADPEADEIRMMTGLTTLPVAKLVFQEAWRSAGDGSAGWTWSRENPFTTLDPEPDRRLDYVFVGYPTDDGAAGEVVEARVEGNQPVDGVQPSDHYAVHAELRY